jgi:hypothetical protein
VLALLPRLREHCSDWRLLCDHKDPAWTTYWASRYEHVAADHSPETHGPFEAYLELQYWEHFQQYWFYLWRQLQAMATDADENQAPPVSYEATLEAEAAAAQQQVADNVLAAYHALGLGARQVDAPALTSRYRGIHLRFTDQAEDASRVYIPSGGLDLKKEHSDKEDANGVGDPDTVRRKGWRSFSAKGQHV